MRAFPITLLMCVGLLHVFRVESLQQTRFSYYLAQTQVGLEEPWLCSYVNSPPLASNSTYNCPRYFGVSLCQPAPATSDGLRIRDYSLFTVDGDFVNVTLQPGEPSSVMFSASDISTRLLPSNATITGLNVSIVRLASVPGVIDTLVTLRVNGTLITAANQCAMPSDACTWSTTQSTAVFGSFGTIPTAFANRWDVELALQIFNNGSMPAVASLNMVSFLYTYE